MTRRNTPLIAFFSQARLNVVGDRNLLHFVDRSRGAIVQANYVGDEDGGLPGELRNGEIARPTNPESFIRVGEVGTGQLEHFLTPAQKKVFGDLLTEILANPARRRLYRN